MEIQDILARLEKVHSTNGGWIACCPAHADSNPSMSITKAQDGKILMHCHAGCDTESIVSAIGLKLSDLMPERREMPQERRKRAKAASRAVARYEYQDERGNPSYAVIRYEPKTFRQVHYENGVEKWGMQGVKRIPYHLPEVVKAAKEGREIIVCEGEKDVDALRKLGFTATCNAGGAGKWEAEWAEYFQGASLVRVIADNDGPEKGFPGQKHAFHVFRSMAFYGIPSDILVMPEGKDVSEFIERRKAGAKEVAAALVSHPEWPKEWCFDGTEKEDADESVRDYTVMTLADFPEYVPEAENPDILVKGRWLERGGSAWIVSTAGTGKSIFSVQLALSWTVGLPFCGLAPQSKLKCWIIQSEDSPSRVTIDREDVIAELTESAGGVDWRAAAREVRFLRFPGRVGAEFLEALDRALSIEKEKPDVVILNPFLAFVGGPITDGAYVTPFLRGGDLNRQPTEGLQAILERHNVACLVFHHTPKPPNANELKQWMKSAFPEYQGAGSADITNWGRSFVTMMKVPEKSGYVCLTAGKNGSEIGWDSIGGAYRHYLAWSGKIGITGRGRHAWRELDPMELAELSGEGTGEDEVVEKVGEIVDALKETAMYDQQILNRFGQGRVAKAAFLRVKSSPETYRLTRKEMLVGRTWRTYYGLVSGIETAARIANQEVVVKGLK